MTDVKQLGENKKSNPIDIAVNKIREANIEELVTKISRQINDIQNATKILKTLKEELKEITKAYEIEKKELDNLLKELK